MEKNIVEFRNGLKKGRKFAEDLLAAAEKDGMEIVAEISALVEKYKLDREFDLLLKKPISIKEKVNVFVAKKRVPEAFFDEAKALIFEKECNDQLIVIIKELVRDFQNVIQVCNNDKMTKPVAFHKLYLMMEAILRMDGGISVEAMSTAFGMNACATYQEYKKGNCDIPLAEEVSFFSDYYNPDGSFKYNSNELGFLDNLTRLFHTVIDDIQKTVKTIIPDLSLDDDLVMEFYKLLCRSNTELFIRDLQKPKASETVKDNVDYDATKALREYYRGGEIVKIPDDIESFIQLMHNCNLNEQEQNYILKLVYAKAKEEKKDIVLTILRDNDLKVYKQAKEILNGLYFTDPDYYVVVEAFNDLTSVCDLIGEGECEDQEYLTEEKNRIIGYLNEFNQKHLATEVISTNNLVLLGDYFIGDLEALTKDKQDRVLSVISRINKDNRGRFRRVMTNENFSFIPYELIALNMRASFVEVDTGIYVLIACSEDDSVYRNTINRLVREDANINIIASDIKDPSKRNNILLESEERIAALKERGRKN